MTQTVVDRLEAVEVEKEEREGSRFARTCKGVLEPVAEQQAIGQSGQGVMQGLAPQLLLERDALADVAEVHDDRVHALFLEQVRERRLDVDPRAVSRANSHADRRDHVGLAGELLEQAGDAHSVRPVEQLGERPILAHDRRGAERIRALVLDHEPRPHEEHDVGGALDDMTEAFLAVRPFGPAVPRCPPSHCSLPAWPAQAAVLGAFETRGRMESAGWSPSARAIARRSLTIALVCIWQTRLSVTPSTAPMSASVNCS